MLLGLAHFKSNSFFEAVVSFSAALNIDQSSKNIALSLFYNRSAAFFKLGRYKDAISDCTEVLKMNEIHAKALFKRGHSHFKLNEFEDCLIDCEESLKLEASEETKKLIGDVKFSLLVQKSKSSYDILGIKRSASKAEVKKAFHKLSLLFHTDKHPGATAVDKKKLERKFQEIKQAYNSIMGTFD